MTTRRCFIRTLALMLISVALATGAQARSCLWKVTSRSGTLYLQGSVHVLKADNYPLAPAIEAAYAASDTLVLEVDMKEMVDPATQHKIMAKAMLPGEETLQQALDEQTYLILSNACNRAGLPITALARFKPWFATMTLSLVQLQRMGFETRHGLDTYFFGKAGADGKSVVGLETVDFQIDLFDSLSKATPSDFVTHALSDLAVIEQEVATLEGAWETGDIGALHALMTKSFEGFPSDFYKTFVLDRNTRWLGTLDGLLQTGKTHMVVVGAGHLSGPGGLLELLKNRGCTLEQL